MGRPEGNEESWAWSDNVDLVKAIAADGGYSGLTCTATAGTNLAFPQACYIGSDGLLELSDADAAASMPVWALALASISEDADGKVLLFGFVRDDDWSFTPGGLLYADTETAGNLTQVAPSGSGDQVQVVGVAVTGTIIFFNPSPVLVEIT